jgi:hypothetical protein
VASSAAEPARPDVAPVLGPIVVVGRPRSGSRLVARLLMDAGVFMGHRLSPESLDPLDLAYGVVAPVLCSPGFDACLGDFPRPLAAPDVDRLAVRVEPLLGRQPLNRVWGWKFCETALMVPWVKRHFPLARFVHVLRDGRDVCCSVDGWFQLAGPRPPGWRARTVEGAYLDYYDFCRAVTFGHAHITRWRGVDLLDGEQRGRHRYLLQMQSWLHCVEAARRHGRALGPDYVEVSFEQLCTAPEAAARGILGWLGLADLGWPAGAAEGAVRRHTQRVHTDSIGSWRRTGFSPRELRDFDRACEHGAALLTELGYQ